MPTMAGGWGRKGRDLDLSAIIVMDLAPLAAKPEVKALTAATSRKRDSSLNIVRRVSNG
jgi:hypothetical protein